MSYDPRENGAFCDRCPLNGQKFVAPEDNTSTMSRFSGTAIAVVGECPSKVEAESGRMFSGPAGTELDKALRMAGIRRSQLHLNNVVLCAPPGKDLKTFLQKLSKYNRTKPANEPTLLSPIECCKPRFDSEIEAFQKFITLGKTANEAVTGSSASIMAVRGALLELDKTERTLPRSVMPTVPPGLLMHQMRYAHVFRNDIAKAGRWFRGEAKFVPPTIHYHPSADFLQAFLRRDTIMAYDLETDGIECLTAKIRCIGIGDENEVVVVGILGKDGFTKFYSPDEEQRVIEVLRDYFTDPNRVKVGHNIGYYDRIVLEQQLNITPAPIVDTILLHKSVESELPHGLAYVVSLYAEAPAWKCYDGETEVLTPEGWVRFDQLEQGTQVAQWEAGVVSFVEPVAYVNQAYTGKAWRLTSQAVDLMVTPDHKMVYRPKGSDRLRVCAVQDLPATGSFPHVGYLESEGTTIHPDLLKLLVAVQADGSWVERSDGWSIDFGFTKERKIERLSTILTSLGTAFSTKQTGTKNPRTRLWLEPSPQTAQIRKLLGPNKIFSPALLGMSVELRKTFLAELPLWDGTKSEDHTNYNTVEKENADFVQAMAVITGQPARLSSYANDEHRRVYRVSLPSGSARDRSWSKIEGMKREQVEYDGRIYCVSVPSGFILVRRNGKVTVSGNTDREGNKLSAHAESDLQLHEYCALDTALTAKVMPKLAEQVQLRGQLDVWKLDQKIQGICADMHTVGMYVDQEERLKVEKKLLKRRQELLNEVRERLDRPAFNPNSVDQLRDLLFNNWKLTPPVEEEERYTTSGDPSTADLILRALLTEELPEDQREVIRKVRYYRKVVKVLGTYVTKLRPWNVKVEDDLGWDDEDEDWIDRETRKKYGLEKTGIVNPYTGRMYPGYNAQVAVTGRLSSSKPINAQNFPKSMRKIVTAAPGNVLIGADMDQLELRIAAARWNVDLYLRAFTEGKDPHSMTAYAVFGEAFCVAAGIDPMYFSEPGKLVGVSYDDSGKFKGDGEAKKMRDLSKAVQYASQYMAKVETVHKLISKTEVENKDGTTDLPYAKLPLRRVREMHANWMKGAPEFEQGWEQEIQSYRRQRFICEDVTFRRRDFLDGESPNEIVNFPIQSTAAALMNLSLIRLAEEIPRHKWGPGTGITNQCHDAIVVECPADGASYTKDENGKIRWDVPKGSIPWRVMGLLEECLNCEHPALPGVKFTATADIGLTWKDV